MSRSARQAPETEQPVLFAAALLAECAIALMAASYFRWKSRPPSRG
jgi:hypothetical protein